LIPKASSLSLVLVIVAFSAIGILFTFAQNDLARCNPPSGSETYLAVYSDDTFSQPVSGAAISGSVQWACPVDINPGYILQYGSVASRTTAANGTVSLGAIIGNYSLTIQYMNYRRTISFGQNTDQPILVRLSLPSGRFDVSECAGNLSISNSGCQTIGLSS
jgi:hypothetical protein